MSNTWCACLKRKFPNSRSESCPPSISFHPTVAFSAHPINIRVTIFQKLRHWSYGEQQRGKNGRWDWMAIWTLKTDEKRIIRYLTVEDVLSSTAKNNRYTVVAYLGYLQRQFKNHYYLSSASNSTAVPMNSCFHFFLSFFVLPWGQSDDWRTVTSMFRVRSNRYFKIQWRGRQEHKKTKRSYKQKQNFALASRLLVHFLPFLHDYDVKLPNFAFYGLSKQATTKFDFSLWSWKWSLGIQLVQEGSPTFDKVIG